MDNENSVEHFQHFSYQDITQTAPELLEQFDCHSPNTSMDDFLKTEALYYHQVGSAVTKTLIDKERNKIIGYYTLRCSCLKTQEINRISGKVENGVVPAIELARFAIDRSFQGSRCPYYNNIKYADMLLDYVMDDVIQVRNFYAGISAVLLFSVDEERPRNFYRHRQFREINHEDHDAYQSEENNDCIPMYKMIVEP